MMTATQCPTAQQWRSFSLGRLSENENDQLYEHLRDCAACQAELETIDDGEDSLISDLRAADDQPGLLDEPACKRALAKALGALAAADELSATGLHNLPRTIGEYEIVRLLGRGGMGNVFLARHNKLGRQVALKFLSAHRLADRRMRDRFDAEMRAVGRLSHPNIVTAHDAREVEGTAVLVTEYIDGFDLGDLVARTGPLSIANASEVIGKVAAALQYTSDQGFVHRDVKPSNIMISRSGEVKLLDLGLARYQSSQEHELTGTGQAIGTADYVSPEQVTDGREVDCRSDLYSLGCTLFKLLTGNAPFADANHASVFAKMTAQVSETPPSLIDRLPDAPAALIRLVDSMLAKDPVKRPQSGSEVVARLAVWNSGHDLQELVKTASDCEAQTRPLPQTSLIRSQPWHQRSISIRAAIAAGLLSGLIGLLMGLFIKITYPDGTVVQLPISGANVEVVEQDAPTTTDDVRLTNSDDLLGYANVQPEDASANAANLQTFLQGIWVIQDQISQDSRDQMWVFAIDGEQFYSVNLLGDGNAVVASGNIVIEFDGTGSRIRFDDQVFGKTFTAGLEVGGRDLVDLRFSTEALANHAPWKGDVGNELTNQYLTYRLGRRGYFRGDEWKLLHQLKGRPLDLESPLGKCLSMLTNLKQVAAAQPAPGSSPSKTERIAQAGPANDLNRLDGVWTFERPDASNQADTAFVAVAFEGTQFVSVASRDGFAPQVSTGKIETMQRDQSGLWMILSEDKSRNKMSFKLQFLDDQSAVLAFDPFSDIKSGPLPNVASFIDKKYVVTLKRRGPLPTTADQMKTLLQQAQFTPADSKYMQSIAMIMQVKSMGAEPFEQASTSLRNEVDRTKSRNHLKQIGLAFHNFHDSYRELPGSSSNRQQGALSLGDQPIQPFSWRVAILPFVEQNALYELYRFNEPWDSEHNLTLIDKMPEVYRSPLAAADQPQGHTNYLGYATGSSALAQAGESALSFRDVTDGTSNTLLVVETKDSVPWTKPEDLSADSQPEFFGPMIYLMLDGSVRETSQLDPELLKKLITRNGGEVIPR